MSREVIQKVIRELCAAATREPSGPTWTAIVDAIKYLQSGVTLTDEGDRVQPPFPSNDEATIEQLTEERDVRECVLDKVLDMVLGVDRPEWSSSYQYIDAVEGVREALAQPVQPDGNEMAQEPVLYQFSVRPASSIGYCDWTTCSRSTYEDLVKIPVVGDWKHRTRALYAQPVQPVQPVQPDPRTEKSDSLLSSLIGIILRNRQRTGYVDGSVVDQVVKEAVDHLKDWRFSAQPVQPKETK